MNAWTDDELGELLRETFHAHEEADDPDEAVRIAWRNAYPVRRRVLPRLAAAAAGVVVVAGVAGVATYAHQHRDSGSSASTAAGGAPSVPASDATNRDAARAEVERLLSAVPLPDGAVAQDHAPTAGLGQAGGGSLEQDSALSRTAWWTVPVSVDDYVAYLKAHHPPGLTGGGWFSSEQTDVHGASYVGPGSESYTPPTLTLTWQAVDGGTAVRADVFIGARWAPSARSRVTGPVRSVVVRIKESGGRVTTRAYRGHDTVERLRRLFNGLPGSFHNEGRPVVASCPMVPAPPPTTTLVFRLADGDVVRARAMDGGCGDSLRVTRDGRTVRPPLDATGFRSGVAAIVS